MTGLIFYEKGAQSVLSVDTRPQMLQGCHVCCSMWGGSVEMLSERDVLPSISAEQAFSGARS